MLQTGQGDCVPVGMPSLPYLPGDNLTQTRPSGYNFSLLLTPWANSSLLDRDGALLHGQSPSIVYGQNPSLLYGNGSGMYGQNGSGLEGMEGPLEESVYVHASKTLKVLHTMVCVFGLLGNILTMLILTRKRLKMSCDGTERTVHTGLTALAVSDLLFCLTLLPYSMLSPNTFSFSTRSFQLVYETYGHAFINTFLLTSTWLTVTIATGRYLAICHPFKARHVIGMRGTKLTIVLVFLTSIVFNIPRLFYNKVGLMACQDGRTAYFRHPGYMRENPRAHTVYIWIYFIVGITLPLATLAFCNFCLARVLRESIKIRRRSRVPAAHVDANHRITSILVTIVVMYIALVSPAEILLFIQDRAFDDLHEPPGLVLTAEITNLLQITNFSCNFILYFVLNIHFRRAMRDMFCAWSNGSQRRSKGSDTGVHMQKFTTVKTCNTPVDTGCGLNKAMDK